MKVLKAMLPALASLWLAPVAFAAPPANDDFADAQVLPAGVPVSVNGTSVEATKEPGEPGFHSSISQPFAPLAGGHSVWFEWEATSAGFVTVGTCGSDFGAFPTVYTGTAIEGLWKVSELDGPGCISSGSQATFAATAGTVYRIAVDGAVSAVSGAATEGSIALQIDATPTPANDDFANATALSERPSENGYYTAHGSGFNWNADTEAGEPTHGGVPGGASVWYSWTVPVSGTAWVSACGEHRLVEAAYTGDAVNTLTPVAASSNECPLKFSAVAGTTYRFAIAGRLDHGTEPALSRFTISASVVEVLTRIRTRKKKSRKRRQAFTFSSNFPDVGFRCRLDRRPFVPCASPKVYTRLAPGRHTFKVVAIDGFGNADLTPAVDRFVILGPKKTRSKAGRSARN